MRNVLVTGANRGLGLEFVRQLAAGFSSETTNIIAACRDPEKAQALEDIKKNSKKSVHILKLDVSNENHVAGLLSEIEAILGPKENLTLLINNAGCCSQLTLENINAAEMDTHFRVNATGPFLIAKTLLPSLARSAKQSSSASEDSMSCSKAAVVNISSTFGSMAFRPAGIEFQFLKLLLPYQTSKVALNMCMRGLAVETAPLGVLVTLMCPGWVSTDMGGPQAPLKPEESIKDMLNTMISWNKEHHGGFFNKTGEVIPW